MFQSKSIILILDATFKLNIEKIMSNLVQGNIFGMLIVVV